MQEILGRYFSGVGSWDASVDAGVGNPSAAFLRGFDATLVWSDYGWVNQTELGDLLADYLENDDGRVVTAVYDSVTCCPASVIRGRWDPLYRVVLPQGDVKNKEDASLETPPPFPNHPVAQSVTGGWTIPKSVLDHLLPNATFHAGSYRIFDFTDGSPVVIARDGVGPFKRNRIDLGWWPSPEEAGGDVPWNDTSNAAGQALLKMTVQSLLYVLSNDSYLCGGTFQVCLETTTVPDLQSYLPTVDPDFLATNFTVTSQTPAAGATYTSGTQLTFTVSTDSGGLISCSVVLTTNTTPCPSSSASSLFAFWASPIKSFLSW